MLTHYETLHAKDILHGFHKRDASAQEKVVSFTTLRRQVSNFIDASNLKFLHCTKYISSLYKIYLQIHPTVVLWK